jgi:hypothetical protein
MATHTIELAIEGGIVDATAPAGVSLSGGIFKRLFDASQEERHRWQLDMPANYASDPVLVVTWSMASSVAGNVVLTGRVKAVTPNTEDIDAAAFAADNDTTQAVPGTLGYTKQVDIALANDDGLAADDWVQIEFARDGASGSDTAAGDLELVAARLEYSD